MAIKAADGVNEGQIAVTEDELRELNNTVSANESLRRNSSLSHRHFALNYYRRKSSERRPR